jgi:type 2 lantibiotic biosynthesis protein LanM
LLLVIYRTLVLEFQAARLEGLLQGNTPAERFQSFLRRLRRPEVALALLREYPVLARQVMTRVEQWARSGLQFLERLCADWTAIRGAFSPAEDPGMLVQVEGGVGDKHRGGQCVLIARFSSGLQVVYKPKALAVDVHVQELLRWLNDRGAHPPFRTLTVLDRCSHGWVEYVAPRDCTCALEVGRFYERQGGYLALLYALEATDFHYENLVAAGEHPVLIDLESLFHPRLGGVDRTQSDQRAGETMAHSVLRVGLLSQRLQSAPDLSGLGGQGGQRMPRPVPRCEAVGTDEMRIVRKPWVVSGGRNRPTLNGAPVEVLDYTEAIVRGFTAVYRLLLARREELLAEAGPFARFAQDEVRVILRPTRTYATLLQESFHPDLLRDALERDRFFDHLWVGVEHRPHLGAVLAAERDDLLNGDIPFFTTRPAARDLWAGAGERLADFFEESGLELVRRRLRQLGDHDLRQQLWFIRAALATLAQDTGGAPERTPRATRARAERTPRAAGPPAAADRERLIAAAGAVGDQLEMLAIHGDKEVSWITLALTPELRWSLMPMGVDLYSGLAGVTLFLAHLGTVTGRGRYASLAQAALATLRRHLDRRPPALTDVGAFNGWGGVIYTLTHLSALWGQPALLAEAERVVDFLPPLIDQDERLDVIGGAAGCIGCLLGLYRCAASERTLAAAVRCGEHLVARAQPMEQGVGWRTRAARARPWTGFSHGAAGIAWALGELAALTGAERFRTTALGAIAYERSLFSPQEGNWPDLRVLELEDRPPTKGPERFVAAWCHGAPGIGLARLLSLPYGGDAATRGEIDTALRTTLAKGFGGNHSLCHGDLGNLELLSLAGEILDDPWCREQVSRLSAVILESIRREGWLCGNPLRAESPGLMTGLAGIGLGLLRLAEPARVPSVLALMPPRR